MGNEITEYQELTKMSLDSSKLLRTYKMVPVFNIYTYIHTHHPRISIYKFVVSMLSHIHTYDTTHYKDGNIDR
jgi:hypothetical protein